MHIFLETTFLHVSCDPVIVSRKYIFGFSKSARSPRYTISDSRLPPCNAISEGRPPLRERSHMTSAAEGGGGFKMLTVADKGGGGGGV